MWHVISLKPWTRVWLPEGARMRSFQKALAALALCVLCARVAQGAESYGEMYSGLDEDAGKRGEAMTYEQALQKAQQGQADKEVLDVFRKGYTELKGNYYMRKTNLAAILLDVANKQGEVSEWTAMYTEAQTLSRQVLAVFPDDEAAKANLKAAKNSLEMRSRQAGGQAPAPAQDSDVAEARRMLDDEGDDDEDDEDQEGEPVGAAGSSRPRAAMTYAQAIQRAQQGKADREVLAVFRDELEKGKASGNAEAIKGLKVNLAALIIDTAKDEAEQSVWQPMYAECIELCEEVLEFFPGDESALANKQAAQAWLDHRTQHVKKMEEAEFLSKMAEPLGPATHGGAPSPPSDGLTEEERARRMLLSDDDDDDEDEKDEL